MISSMVSGIVRILDVNELTVGAGFVVSQGGLIATCAHVVRQAGAGPGDTIHVAFCGGNRDDATSSSLRTARVESAWWRDANKEDVSILQLESRGIEESVAILPGWVKPLTLGTSFGVTDQSFNTFGFPAAKPVEGLPGKCEVIGHVTEDGYPVLTIRSNEISYGFSGAPVWDNKNHTVIGMVVSTIPASFDPAGKQSETSFLIPVETLREVCEKLELVEHYPYRGLEPFEAVHAAYYSGRDGAVRDMIGLLSKHNFVSVVGVSGSGKSSLVRAGLAKGLRNWDLPGLVERHCCVFNLGNTPYTNLIFALSVHDPQLQVRIEHALALSPSQATETRAELIKDIYDREPEVVAQTIRSLIPEGGMILVADQFERLYTEGRDENLPVWFAKFLLALASDEVKVLITVRADFYSLALEHAGLGQVIKSAQVTLLSMSHDELYKAIEEPARTSGRIFEPGLIERLIADVSERAGDLPLLQFALTELWSRDARKGILTINSYESLGYFDPTGARVAGVKGIIVKRAEEIWQRLSDIKKLAAQKVFLMLIAAGPSVDSSSDLIISDTSRRAWQAEWDPLTREVAQELASSFLLTAGKDAFSGEPTVEVAHEALIRVWPRLQQWVKDYRPFVSWYDHDLAPYLRNWLQGAKGPGSMLPPPIFNEARRWVEQYPMLLSGPPAEYITSSIRAYEKEEFATRRRRRRLIQTAVATGAVILILIGLSLIMLQRYKYQELQAKLNLARDLYERGLGSLSRNEMLEAEIFFAKSLRLDDRHETREHLLEARAKAAQFLRSRHPGGAVLAIDSEGEKAVLGGPEGRVKYWSTGGVYDFPSHKGVVNEAALSSDCRLVAYTFARSNDEAPWEIAKDGAVYLWDMQRRELVKAIEIHTVPGYEGLKQVSTITFSPKGRFLAYGAEDGVIRLWDVELKRELPPLLGCTQAVRAVAFNPAETQVASAGDDSTIRLWEIAGAKPLRRFIGHEDTIPAIAFDPKGERMASGSADGTVRLWDIESGKEEHSFTGHLSTVETLAFSPKGHLMASGSDDGTVRILDLDAGKETLKLSSYGGPISKTTFSDDGKRLIAGGKGDWIKLWGFGHTKEVLTLNCESPPTSIAFSPHDNLLASADSESKIRIWDLDHEQETLPPLTDHSGQIFSIAFDPTGQLLVSGGEDKIVRLWNLKEKRVEHKFVGHQAQIWGIAFSPTGPLIASGSYDQTIRLWDIEKKVEVARFAHDRGPVLNVAFNSNGVLLASAGRDRTARVWNIKERREVYRFSHDGEVWGLAFSAREPLLASSSTDRTIRLWSLKDNREIHRFNGHEGTVTSIAFDPSGTWLVSGSLDHTVRLWNVLNNGELTLRIHERPVWWVAFSPDGRHLASAGLDRKIEIWDMDIINLVLTGDSEILLQEAEVDTGFTLDDNYEVHV